jgi:type II secretion system protein I
MTARGFTLLEALVAIVIVGLVSVSTLAAVAAASRASDRAARAAIATELAEERLASLLTLPAPVLADSADDVDRDIAGMRGWRWSAAAAPRDDGLMLLTVRVSGDEGGVERSVLRPGGGP